MEARNRHLPEWFNRVRSGQVLLPRFQRHEAWSHDKIAGLLQTVVRGLPAGAVLVLEVGDKEFFKSRPVVGAPTPTERVSEHLLDGQQRLTALWRSMNGNYDDRTYFVYFERDEENDGTELPKIIGQPRWVVGNAQYPQWADRPAEIHRRGYLPVTLLTPAANDGTITSWCRDAIGSDAEAILKLKDLINDLRARVAAFSLPFLSLPVGTPKHVALEVYIQMNTSAVQLSSFDIVVAEVEAVAEESLHELVGALRSKVPSVASYGDPSDFVLRVAAMREDRPPTQASYLRLDFERLVREWDRLVAGLTFAV